MIPVLLPLILMLPAPVKTLDCGHGHRLLAKQNTITLNRGKAPLAQSLTILAQDEPLACAWLKKHKLLTVRGARRTSIIAIAAGRLKVVRRVFSEGFETSENIEFFDPVLGELYRRIASNTPCWGKDVRSFRRRYNHRKGTFEPVRGTSISIPKGLIPHKALPGPLPGTRQQSLVPFSVTGASSWQGDVKTGDYEPPTIRQLTDLDPRTVWISGDFAGKGSYFTFARSVGPFGVMGLRIFPGNYRSAATLGAFPRIRRFALYNEKGVGFMVTIPSDPLTMKGSATRPFHVRFPSPLKAACITVVILDWYPARKSGGKKAPAPRPPLALSELTFFSTLDVEADPLTNLRKHLEKQTITWSAALGIMKRLPDGQILRALKEARSADLKRMALFIAVTRNDPRFLPWLIDALSWAQGDFLEQLSKRLSSPSGLPHLETMIRNTTLDRALRKLAFRVYLKGGKPSLSLLLTTMGQGDSRDYRIRHLVERTVKGDARKHLMEEGCKKSDIYRYSGFLWLFARWTAKDPRLSPTLAPCLKKKMGKSFTQRMRYLFAAQQCHNCGLLPQITTLYSKDPRTPVKARAVQAAASMEGGFALVKSALSSPNPVIRAAAVKAMGKKALPSAVYADFNSEIPDLAQAVQANLMSRCDPQSHSLLKSALGKRLARSAALHIIEECRFSPLAKAVFKLFNHEKNLMVKARLALTLGRLNHAPSFAHIHTLFWETFNAGRKLPHSGKKLYAAGTLLEALNEFPAQNLHPFWLKLLKNPLPRSMWSVITPILGHKCPPWLKKMAANPNDPLSAGAFRSLRLQCGWRSFR